MMKALKFCDVLTTSPRQTTCQYRAATIHHRLASLYHNTLRTMVTREIAWQIITIGTIKTNQHLVIWCGVVDIFTSNLLYIYIDCI